MHQVWDIQDQNCLLTLRPKSHRISGDIQTCHYSSLSKTLVVATDRMNALSLTLRYVLCRCIDHFSGPGRALSVCVFEQ